MKNEVIIRFDNVSFEYGHLKPILHEVSFSLREGAKFTLMGQNGAGKSTLFKLITRELHPEEGSISIREGATIGTARQVVPQEEREYTVQAFFERAFNKKVYDIEPRVKKILEVVHLNAPLDRKVGTFSGGQQARLLLAFALIQNPDILLLDEPTNNLDKAGIEHLTKFLQDYEKTVIVISHDAEFLNSFTQGVLYLDIHSRKVEQYVGNYLKVVEEIKQRVERERRENVKLAKEIEHRKEQANFFAQKGGKMRNVAKKMWTRIDELEEEKIDVRQEDRTIKEFTIPAQEFADVIARIQSIAVVKEGKSVAKKVNIILKKKQHLLLAGPNGIGKSTFLDALANGKAKGAEINPEIKVGYFRQDFSNLNFEETAYNTLAEVMKDGTEEELRSTAAHFLLGAEVLKNKIKNLSEGQKGLLMFARLVLQRPGLLLLDEPTNHMNFRHIPVIAKALDKYQGAMILVSHVPEFVSQIKIDETLNLGELK